MTTSQQKNKAVLYLIWASFCFAIMNTFVKLSGDLPSFQKAFIRSAVILFFSGITVVRNKQRFFPSRDNAALMLVRCLVGTVGLLANYYAVDHMILSDATMLQKLAPFFTILFSFLLLQESISTLQMFCVIGSFAGALLIIRPTWDIQVLPALVGVIGALASGLAYTLVRRLGMQGEESTTIVFNYALVSAVAVVPFLFFSWAPLSLSEFIKLFISGLAAYFAQQALTSAYALAPSREISVFEYSQLLFAAFIGLFFFQEIPDVASILGYGVIIGASVVLFVNNKKQPAK